MLILEHGETWRSSIPFEHCTKKCELDEIADQNHPSTSQGDANPAGDTAKRIKTSTKTAYGPDSRILMSATFKCARASWPKRSENGKQRSSKKVGCNYELVCTIRRDQPGIVHWEERHGHNGHVPGSEEDLKYLKPLNRDNVLLDNDDESDEDEVIV